MNENRIEATVQNLVGKVQEAIGDLTGDQKTKAEGQLKQAQAAAEHAKEDIKDAIKGAVDEILS
ncbi:MAG: CsbD family protein [Thermostichales cyanobacterium SZTDM-1c_bins_54]